MVRLTDVDHAGDTTKSTFSIDLLTLEKVASGRRLVHRQRPARGLADLSGANHSGLARFSGEALLPA